MSPDLITVASLAAALERGAPAPLGARADGHGVNFAVFSEHAQRIELCTFDAGGTHELRRYDLPARTGHIWHGYLAGARPGLVYGYRAHGPYRPMDGHRFNPNKLLLDPYARGTVGQLQWGDQVLGYQHGHADRDLSFSAADSAASVPKACVTREPDPVPGGTRPRIPAQDTVLYELHVRGYTMLHPKVEPGLRGTYAGLGSEAVIRHLQRLGVTTLQLLPVHLHVRERRLHDRGLQNYWGYNTLGFFCPHPGYGSPAGGACLATQFRSMVRALHAAGLEVLIDVVFNHTAESDELGPTLSFRGLDNRNYYRTRRGSPNEYENFSGCGNTLNLAHPNVLQMVLDCLRYWACAMEVDGFRFDLAAALGRGADGFDPACAFFQAIAQDPLLSQLKLVAEPWDCGADGYQLGRFPVGWLEWNDRFRDCARGYWLMQDARRDELARRLTASADRFDTPGRAPWASVNYVAAHDGFTLADLVQYEHRHNEANGEDNRDGAAHNLSCSCGIEGATDDAAVLEKRRRLKRALLATLLLAQGTPMLTAGDESGRSQQGNNNAYCQDNEISWLNWQGADAGLEDFVAGLIRLRRTLRPLDARRWYPEYGAHGAGPPLQWLRPDASPMGHQDWHDRASPAFGCRVAGPGVAPGELLILLNAGPEPVDFSLPPGAWRLCLDSSLDQGVPRVDEPHRGGFALRPHAAALMQRTDNGGEHAV